MSTRSNIAYKTKNGEIHAVYCHYDGYLDGVGKTLKDYYNSSLKAKRLVDGGGISALNKNREGGLPVELGYLRVRYRSGYTKFPHLCDDPTFCRVMNTRYGDLDYKYRVIRMNKDWENNTRYYNIPEMEKTIYTSLDEYLKDSDALCNIEFVYIYDMDKKAWEYNDVWNDGLGVFKPL